VLTKQIACEAELRFAAEFVRGGYKVFIPTSEDGSIDLVIHKDMIFRKVQVKSTKIENGALTVKLRSTNNWSNRKYTKNDVDIIGVYDYENKVGYLLEMKDFDGMSVVMIRVNSTKNNQKEGVRLAEKYLFF